MPETRTLPAAPREVRVNREAMEANSMPEIPGIEVDGCDCVHCMRARRKTTGPFPVFTVTEPDGTLIEALSVKILGPCQLVYEQGKPVETGCGAGPIPARAFIRTDAKLEIKL